MGAFGTAAFIRGIASWPPKCPIKEVNELPYLLNKTETGVSSTPLDSTYLSFSRDMDKEVSKGKNFITGFKK